MKKVLLAVGMVFLVLTLTGCGAFFGNSAQWERENWYGLTSADQVARIKQDKLALEKLKALPAQVKVENGVIHGYRGIVANMGTNNRYTFRIIGPEKKSYYLGPGMRTVDYLEPGEYTFEIYNGNSLVQAPLPFTVGPRLHRFLDEDFHWFAYAEW